jgi:hypothetical protein
MVLDKIEQLVIKYENGETTLQEEALLKDYFSKETVAPHLEMYKPMFVYFLAAQQEQSTKDVALKPRKTYGIYKWISVAAVAVLMFSLYTQINKPVQYSDEQIVAYNKTVGALNLLSSTFNKGTENLQALDIMSSNFKKGAQSLEHVDAFTKTTNKIFKTKQ